MLFPRIAQCRACSTVLKKAGAVQRRGGARNGFQQATVLGGVDECQVNFCAEQLCVLSRRLVSEHVLAQRGVDAALVAAACGAEEGEDISVEAERDLRLVIGRDEF